MTEKKLKIVFISSWYPNKLKPLNGIFVKRHALANTIDCEVSALFVCSADSQSVEESVEDGVFTLRGYYPTPKFKIPILFQVVKLIRYFTMWKKIWTLYTTKRGKPDLVNSNIIYPVSIIATFIKFIYGIPFVITEHWTGYLPEDGRYKGFIKKIISKTAVKNAKAVITPSHKLNEMLQLSGLVPEGAKGEKMFYTIPNVVDITLFQIKPPVAKLKGTINFLHVSSLDESQKNITGIVRVFNLFHSTHPQSTLTIIGNEQENEFSTSAKEPLPEDGGVILLGKKEGAELVELMQQADAFVLFSNFENLPVVILESLCCGVPVISTRVGDLPDYINPTNGLLVEPNNEKQLLEAMEKMYLHLPEYNSAEIRNTIAHKVSPASISTQLTEVYKAVLTP